MDLGVWGAMAGFACVTTVTPGPNNMMLMASGANFGLRRTLPHMLGVGLGLGAMVAVLGLGVDRLFALWPWLGRVMGFVALSYILWLAWRIAQAGAPKEGAARARPIRFIEACAFQWVNPKAWAMGLGALAAYGPGLGGAWAVALIFVAVSPASNLIWIAAGQGLSRALSDPRRLRLFNRAMALLLVATMLPVLFGGALSLP